MTNERLIEMRREIKDEKAVRDRRKEEKRKIDEQRDDELRTLYKYTQMFPDKIKLPKETRIVIKYETISTWFGLRRKCGAAIKWDRIYRCPECDSVAKNDMHRDGSSNQAWADHDYWRHVYCKCGWEYVEKS